MIHIKTLFKSRSLYELLINRRRVAARKQINNSNTQSDVLARAITYHAVLKNGRLSMS
jgi:hypothetical protein